MSKGQSNSQKTPKKGGKLRRLRSFSDDAPIQSQLPHAEAPHSRKYARKLPSRENTGVLRTIPKTLELDSAVDRIICADACKLLKKLPDEWCACAITSPPYWHTVDYGVEGQIGLGSYEKYLDDLDMVWGEIARVLLPNGKFCLNVPILPLTKSVSESAFGPSHTRVLVDLYSDMKRHIEAKTELRLFSLYIWEKQTTEKMFGSYPYPPNLYERNYIEFIAVFVKPGSPRVLPPEVKEASKLSQEDWLDLTQQIWWMYPENIPRLEGHPAPFPEALPNRLISMYTFRAASYSDFPGDIVLDPFVGSGTTCVAARRLGRKFIGIDLNLEFCNFAQHRVSSTPPNPCVMSGRRPSERQKTQLRLGLEG